jgi:hypothetical protein
MSLISKETLLTHLQRAEMASDVRLPIEFFRDWAYQAMPRTWVGLTDEDIAELHHEIKVRLMGTYKTEDIYRAIEAKLKEKNT